MELNIGDFVKVKEGLTLETGKVLTNWAGKINEIYPEYKTCLVELDSITLNLMDDDYILDCIEEGTDPYEYVFHWDDLIKSSRRDSDKELVVAREKMDGRLMELDEDYEENFIETIQEKWISEFEDSDFFTSLNDYQKERSRFILDTFMDYMYNYQDVVPNEWSSYDIEEVCLDIVPRKITAEIELFENYGDVLLQFFKFLEEVGYTSVSKEFQDTVIDIKDQIPENASNPENWGMAKSMMMGAQEAGYNINDQEELNAFMMNYRQQALANLGKTQSNKKIEPAKKNPFQNIGRNDRITVKYSDGTIKEHIKFKIVQQDLLDGKCELIKK